MHANQREDLEQCIAGDIVAIVGPKKSVTGDTLCDKSHKILLESIFVPQSVIDIAIEPKTKADSDKMTNSLALLAEEDPTFHYSYNEETGQVIISGMGELHLEIIVDRLLREYKVAANIGKPQVAYREAITQAVEGIEGKLIRQTGGRGAYGHVIIDVKPSPIEKAEVGSFIFNNAVVGGEVPKEYINKVRDGIADALKAGIVAGFPVLGIEVTLVGGSSHPVDSNEMAFKAAGAIALQEALKRCHPRVLEPTMRVEVVVARGVHRRCAWRHRLAPRAGQQHRTGRIGLPDAGGRSAAVGDVRLFD